MSSSVVSLTPGTYPILVSLPISGAKVIRVQGKEYFAIDSGPTKLLLEKQ